MEPFQLFIMSWVIYLLLHLPAAIIVRERYENDRYALDVATAALIASQVGSGLMALTVVLIFL